MNKIRILLITVILILLVILGVTYLIKPKSVIPANVTLTKIYNVTDSAVTVYITLGATPGCLQNVSKIPFITSAINSLQGTFVLNPGDSTIAYAPDSAGYNGVISFKFAPDNCPDSIRYPLGINQYEFMINNAYQPGNPQESINISCVHGVNCVIRVDMITSNPFNAGPSIPSIVGFANSLNRSALGLAGVYPYGCDTCTGSKTPPTCIPLPQPKQVTSICQIQRPANQSGGLIKVIYMGSEQPADGH
jgi:hypothetical protein